MNAEISLSIYGLDAEIDAMELFGVVSEWVKKQSPEAVMTMRSAKGDALAPPEKAN